MSGTNEVRFGLKIAYNVGLVECAIGIIVNTLLLVVIISNPLNNLRKSSWVTISNLALADLLTSVTSIPFFKPEIIANVTAEFWANASFFMGHSSSFFFLLLFSVERYVVVKYPIKSHSILTKTRVYVACLTCWGVAITIGGTFLYRGSNQYKLNVLMYGVLELAAVLMIVFTVLLIVEVKAASRRDVAHKRRVGQARDISMVLIIIVFIFMVTTFPYFIMKQFEAFARENPRLFRCKSECPYYYFPVACLNFVVNPFIYAWHLPEYRCAVVALFTKRIPGERRRRYQSPKEMQHTARDFLETSPIKNNSNVTAV